MPWLKTDDGTWCEPWVVRAGNEAFGVYQRLASYCAQYLTDGLVPPEIAAMITATSPSAVERLEDAGQIQRQDTGSLYLPRFLDDNPTRQEAETNANARRKRAQAGAAARWGKDQDIHAADSRGPADRSTPAERRARRARGRRDP